MWLSGPWRTRRRDTRWAADGEGNGVRRGEQKKKREARKTMNKRRRTGREQPVQPHLPSSSLHKPARNLTVGSVDQSALRRAWNG